MRRLAPTDMVKRLRTLFRDERGGATVEFVILLPAYIILLGAIFSITMTMLGIGQVYDVARDVARRVAVGEITEAEAERLVVSMLPAMLQATASIDQGDARSVRLSVTVNPQYNVLGSVGVLLENGITATYVMRRENMPVS